MTTEKYGRKLTTEEYQKATVSLYDPSPDMKRLPSDADLRRAELNLQIDYKLGVDFPRTRRDAMWQAAQELERNRLRPSKTFSALFRGKANVFAAMTLLAVEAYEKVLDDTDLVAFLTDSNGADKDGVEAVIKAHQAKRARKHRGARPKY